ncbi:MAG: hypothetical protein VX815_05535 [Gemmatimonadota bacterium]|nr:hypothetical protein [Gemmatimonadota bacterium]
MNEPHAVLQEIWVRQGMTIDDLVDEAARLLPTVAGHQTRYARSMPPWCCTT